MNSDDGPDADEYFRITSTQQPHHLLLDALGYIEEAVNKFALDLGCGAGRDTKGLLAKGFKVTAVDIEARAGPYINELASLGSVQFICSPFDQFTFGVYDFINAQWSLPFNSKAAFDLVMASALTALKPGGIFTGNFFGVRDGWNTASSTKTFLSEVQARAWFEHMRVLYFKENEQDGTLADGKPKHWHTFDFIVRKPAN